MGVSEAMGREVTQLDLGVMVGLNLAFVEVRKWEEERTAGPRRSLSYLSQGCRDSGATPRSGRINR